MSLGIYFELLLGIAVKYIISIKYYDNFVSYRTWIVQAEHYQIFLGWIPNL